MARDLSGKVLAGSTLVNTCGTGLYIAGSALFFTKGLGLPVYQVGLGLTCAGLLGLTTGIYVGRLADRHGPRNVLILIQFIQASAEIAFLFTGRSLATFIPVATIVIAGMQGADAARGALIGKIASSDPVRLRAIVQSVSNIGISLGTVAAGFLIAGGTHRDYQLLMIGDAATFIAAALVLFRLPNVAPADQARGSKPERTKWVAVRDRPYLALTAANCVMALQYFVLAFAMPLWVLDHTRAPRWLISPLLLINTVMIVLLQVRFGRGAKTPTGAGRSALRAGLVLAASMLLYSVASGRDEGLAVALLIAAVVAHSFGELLQSSGSFGISYGLASPGALGEYLGVYGLGFGICRAVAPGILAATCLSHGTIGWVGLAVLFTLSGGITPLLVRRAEHSRGSHLGVTSAPEVLPVADAPTSSPPQVVPAGEH